MKKCKKCGAILPDKRKVNICNGCLEKTIETLSPLLFFVASAIISVFLKDNKAEIPVKNIPDISKNLALAAKNNADTVFGGLPEKIFDSLAKETNRGVKAIVHGDTLEYIYKSASGKTNYSAIFKIDKKGDLVFSYLSSKPHSNSPHFYRDKLLEILANK